MAGTLGKDNLYRFKGVRSWERYLTLSEEDLLVIQAADDGASVLFGVILTNLFVIILKWENDVWWWTILLIIISLLSLRPVFVGNETLILSEAGIVIKDGKYKRQYLWDELPVKRINANCVNLGRGINKYHECIVFSKSRFLRPRFLNPVYIKMLFNRSVFCIYLKNGDEKSKNIECFQGAIEKDIIVEKLKEWHVELEDNKLEERPPWKEQI